MKVVSLVALTCSACLSRPSPSIVIDATGAPHNFAFVTALPRTISSFTDLGALDAHCGMLGAAHQMPGTYVAWFSNPGVNAIARLGDRVGWVRPDGEPFANLPADIVSGRIYNPLRITESQTDLGDGAAVATGTFDDGTYHGLAGLNDGDCFGSPPAMPGHIGYGVSDATTTAWTWMGDNAIDCASSVHFYCFEIDYQNPIAKPTHSGRLAFLSSAVSFGDVTRASLDAQCQSEANSLTGKPHVVALVATNGASPLARLDLTGPPWVRYDGVWFMSGDGTQIHAPLNYTLTDEYLLGTAWTGTKEIATAPATDGSDNCSDWTVGTQNAQAGSTFRSSRTKGFGMAATNRCADIRYHLYCLEP